MSGVQAITAKIISKAENSAKEILKSANAECDQKKARLAEHLETLRPEKEEKLAIEVEAIKERRQTLAKLESRMLLLGAKQAVINSTYEKALLEISSLPAKTYKEFFTNLILKFADDGDVAIISKADANKLDAEFIKTASEKCKKKITLSKENCDAKGGLILSGKVCEKDLTLETLMAECRTVTENEILEILFNE